MRITVVGMGYLGTAHAAGMAELGHEALGVDIDAGKVELLAAGTCPFYEPGLGPLLRKHVESGRVRATTSFAEAAEFGEVHFLCVGTPQKPDGPGADTSQVFAAARALGAEIRRSCLVVGKSTVPVGTAARLERVLAELAPPGVAVELAWNPEFLREGHAVHDTLHPDRIVLGVRNQRSAELLRALYRPVTDEGCPVVETDFNSAELVKTAANAFLTTKISFINAVAEVCELAGADVPTIARAIGYDERIGPHFLRAGVGFGGGCLPKDIRSFQAVAADLGAVGVPALMRVVDQINNDTRQRVVDTAVRMLDGQPAGRRVAVLGAAFKPDSDDVRDSPALAAAMALKRAGALVRVYDPVAVPRAREVCPELEYTRGVAEALDQAELTVLLTEWTEFRELDPVVAAGWVASPRMLDARNVLTASRWRDAGWTCQQIGSGPAHPRSVLSAGGENR